MKVKKPSKNRVAVQVLVEANEKMSGGGIIIPEAHNVTKELAIGKVILINDPDEISGAKEGDMVAFRSMSAMQIGEGVSVLNVNHVECIVE